MESLQRELIGNQQLIIDLKYDANFQSILGKIEFLINNEVEMIDFRKDIFDCISLVKQIIKNCEVIDSD
jgi:hypothetical protein